MTGGTAETSPGPWAAYGLRESPFFTGALSEEEGVSQGIHLFRGDGRSTQAQKLVGSIRGRQDSVWLIEGPSGDGKTSFVNRAKYLLLEGGGYVVCHGSIPIESGKTGARQLAAEILHGALSAFRSHPELGLEAEEAEEEVEGLILDELIKVSEKEVGISSILSASWTRSSILSEAAERPLSEWMDAIVSVRDIAESAGLRGIVLHINNLDQASRSDAEHVGRLFGDIKDLLQIQGFHYLLCADRRFRTQALAERDWSQDVIGHPVKLDPLTRTDVEAIVKARYLDEGMENADIIRPVEPSTIARLYEALDDDLRFLFSQLEHVFIDEIGPTSSPETKSYDELIEILLNRHDTARQFLQPTCTEVLDVLHSLGAMPEEPVSLATLQEEINDSSNQEVVDALRVLRSDKRVGHRSEEGDGDDGYHLVGLPLLRLRESA